MRTALLVLVLIALFGTVMPSPAASAASDPVLAGHLQPPRTARQEETDSAPGPDLSTPVLWTITGAIIGALAMGLLYGLKRKIGGFPENPSWVAPISIEPSRTFPDDAGGEESDSPDGHG